MAGSGPIFTTCQANDATARASLHYFCTHSLCLHIPCMSLKMGFENKYPNICLLLLFIQTKNDWKIANLLLIICNFCSYGFLFPMKIPHFVVYISLHLLCFLNLQASGHSCTLNKNCHPGQLAAMKHLFCFTFPGT